MRLTTDSTICAIATGNEGAPRGILRMTGPDTIAILKNLFRASRHELDHMRSPSTLETSLDLPQLGTIPISLFCWPTHRSYTGQPSAELHLLGAPVVLRELEGLLVSSGARLAQPGEFTLRAFLAGRMDLTQCEAVLGLIHAKGERAMRVALEQLAGGLTQPLQRLRHDLIDLLADLEAGLDFVDEDIEFISSSEVLRRLEQASAQLQSLRHQLTQRTGHDLAPRVVLAGLPNAGKSSLFNALSRADLAIASPLPGTTRDFVKTRLERAGIAFDLVDTAGIDRGSTRDEVEAHSLLFDHPDRQSQAKTWAQLTEAELVLYCSAADLEYLESIDRNRQCLEDMIEHSSCDVWQIFTKCDTVDPRAEAVGALSHLGISREWRVSAMRGDGIAELLEAVASHVARTSERDLDVVPMTGQRCREAIERAQHRIDDAAAASESDAGDEVIAGELRLALDELGQVAGTVVNNDVLDALFSRFCIGK